MEADASEKLSPAALPRNVTDLTAKDSEAVVKSLGLGQENMKQVPLG